MMASKQMNMHEVIAQVMAEAMIVAIQAMAAAGNERSQNIGPRLGGPTMKQPISTGKQKINTTNSKTSG